MITCAWCHLPATFVWSNRDPGLVDDNRDVNPHWPIEVERDTPTCLRCEEMIDANQIVEMMERALTEWIRQFGGVPPTSGWHERAWATQSARVEAWIHHRDVAGEIPWETFLDCGLCRRDTWHGEDRAANAFRCSICGHMHVIPLKP